MSSPAVVMAMLSHKVKLQSSLVVSAPPSAPSVEVKKPDFGSPNLHVKIDPETGKPVITGKHESVNIKDCRYISSHMHQLCSGSDVNGGEGVCLKSMKEYV
jgi:hypothetical protein